jgi:hypothetical protein
MRPCWNVAATAAAALKQLGALVHERQKLQASPQAGPTLPFSPLLAIERAAFALLVT